MQLMLSKRMFVIHPEQLHFYFSQFFTKFYELVCFSPLLKRIMEAKKGDEQEVDSMPNKQEVQEREKYEKLDQIIEQYRDQQGQIIRILQKAQNLFGYLPLEVQTHVSKSVDIPISDRKSVV